MMMSQNSEQSEAGVIAVPGTGEIVALSNENECARALASIRDFEVLIRQAKAVLTEAIVERSRELGTKTITLSNGDKAQIRGGQETIYDAQQLEADLRALNAPEDLISEIVTQEVTYKVNAKRAKQAAAANPQYRAVVASAATTVEKPNYVVIERKTK